MPTTPPEFAYDVFISYSHRDKAWVRRELLPRLESAGLKVCVDYRDFRIGAPIVKEMERAVLTSRHTLAVLTPAYLDSAWADFEALMIATLDPAGRKARFLPLLLELCELPTRIGYVGHADFTTPDDIDLAWQLLFAALAPANSDGQPDGAPPAPSSSPRDSHSTPPAPSQPAPASEFNTAAVRELLTTAFGDEDFDIFCYDNFQVAAKKFTLGMTFPQKAQILLAHCDERGLMEDMLARVQKANPYQYARFEGLLRNVQPQPPKPPEPKPVPDSLPPNPFAGVSTIKDAAHFVGREAELRRLRALLQAGSAVLIGEPKIGLSSLLQQVKRTWQGTVIGPLDCQELDGRNDFYEYLARELGLAGHAWPPIREKLKTSEVLLLVDELDAGPAHGIKLEDLARFRAVASANSGFRMVTISHRPLKQVFPNAGSDSPGYNFLQPLTIGVLNGADAAKLIEHPWAPDAPQFEPAVRDELLKLAGGHPFKLHRAAFHRYEALIDPTYDWLAAYRQDLENLL